MRRNILYIIILLCLLTACSKKAKLPSDHIIFLDEDLKVRNMQRVTEGFINDEANIELIDFQSENILYPAYPFDLQEIRLILYILIQFVLLF